MLVLPAHHTNAEIMRDQNGHDTVGSSTENPNTWNHIYPRNCKSGRREESSRQAPRRLNERAYHSYRNNRKWKHRAVKQRNMFINPAFVSSLHSIPCKLWSLVPFIRKKLRARETTDWNFRRVYLDLDIYLFRSDHSILEFSRCFFCFQVF